MSLNDLVPRKPVPALSAPIQHESGMETSWQTCPKCGAEYMLLRFHLLGQSSGECKVCTVLPAESAETPPVSEDRMFTFQDTHTGRVTSIKLDPIKENYGEQ